MIDEIHIQKFYRTRHIFMFLSCYIECTREEKKNVHNWVKLLRMMCVSVSREMCEQDSGCFYVVWNNDIYFMCNFNGK